MKLHVHHLVLILVLFAVWGCKKESDPTTTPQPVLSFEERVLKAISVRYADPQIPVNFKISATEAKGVLDETIVKRFEEAVSKGLVLLNANKVYEYSVRQDEPRGQYIFGYADANTVKMTFTYEVNGGLVFANQIVRVWKK